MIKILIEYEKNDNIKYLGINGEELKKTEPRFISKYEKEIYCMTSYYNSEFITGREKVTRRNLIKLEEQKNKKGV